MTCFWHANQLRNSIQLVGSLVQLTKSSLTPKLENRSINSTVFLHLIKCAVQKHGYTILLSKSLPQNFCKLAHL